MRRKKLMALPVRNKEAQTGDKMRLPINIDMANVLLEYSISSKPLRNHHANLKQLLSVLDMSAFRSNYDISDRLTLTQKVLDTKLELGISNMRLLKEHIKEENGDLIELIDNTTWRSDVLKASECRMVTDWIEEKMQFYFFYTEMPALIKLWKSCIENDFVSNADILNEINTRVSKLVIKMKNSSMSAGLLKSLNFASPDFGEVVRGIVNKAQSPSAILQTGIRNLNAILGPGFRGGKLYTILGMSGKFKSGTLLNIADQITKFNPCLEKVVDGRRNTLLFITMENSIDETVERLYNMYADPTDDFLRASPDDVLTVLRDKGHFCFDNDMADGISIELRYYSNMEITTNEIYRIVDDMEANGMHCIGVILDYIKRINSVYPSNGDETLRVTYVAKELKTIALHYDIPVITAQQINRMGNAVVDSAMRDGKQDLIRFVGNSDIGGAWGVIEESDWVAIINLERHVKTGRTYLTIKRTKNRCGQCDVSVSDYFNHPFTNGREIRLETDVDKEASVSIMSLATDLNSVDIAKYEENDAQQRPKVSFNNESKRAALHALCA